MFVCCYFFFVKLSTAGSRTFLVVSTQIEKLNLSGDATFAENLTVFYRQLKRIFETVS